MSIYIRLRRLMSNPPRMIAYKVGAHAWRRSKIYRLKLRDRFLSSYSPDSDVPQKAMARLIPALNAEEIKSWQTALIEAAEQICQHDFDLLGSGSVNLNQQFKSDNEMPRMNRLQAFKLRQLISPNYKFIAWNTDIQSGYSWPKNVMYTNIVYGDVLGVDVKFPWEMARMHHASTLALAYSQHMLLGNQAAAHRLCIEFQDQVLDFLAANPPRFGVNWACTMDVSIRMVNLLVAYDLFKSFGASFSADFEFVFKRSVMEHGRHIISNLEWFEDLRSNHYLSNIAGLFFIAAYLPENSETNSWLVFAANELSKEFFSQFNSDGSNFEGSTSYHRLSAEMVTFSVALAHRIATRLSTLDWDKLLSNLKASEPGILPKDRLVLATHKIVDQAVLNKLGQIAFFSRAVTRPDSGVVQIGDNDSGRFIKLTPASLSLNSHELLTESIDMLCNPEESQGLSIDSILIKYLLSTAHKEKVVVPTFKSSDLLLPFEQFGVYVYRRKYIWMSVRCGAVGQNGNGGHAHNDQLSIEVCFGGLPFLADPGTYVYTPFPTERNAFRSTRAHATLVAEPGEQNEWLDGRHGLFSLSRVAPTRVIDIEPHRFVGEHDGFTQTHRRSIELFEREFRVLDECLADKRELVFPLAPEVIATESDSGFLLERAGVRVMLELPIGTLKLSDGWYSPVYGQKVETRIIRVTEIPTSCHWRMILMENADG